MPLEDQIYGFNNYRNVPQKPENRGRICFAARFLVFLVSLLGFEGLLLAVPALILQLLQLLQDSSRLVGGVYQHAQELEAKATFEITKK